MSMNWTNYDRLTRHLETMESRLFNYAYSAPHSGRGMYAESLGCVACQCLILAGRPLPVFETSGGGKTSSSSDIQRFLNVSDNEAFYLYNGHEGRDVNHGDEGIREALRRLALVASRYQRPSSPLTESVNANDDEAAFLASVRALIQQPMESEGV